MSTPLSPPNTWAPTSGCTSPTDPSIAYGITLTGVPAVIGSVPNGTYAWSITLNDGGTPPNFTIDRYDNTGALIDHPIFISGADGSVTLTQDPTNPLGAATKRYVDSLPGGVKEAPNDGTSYVRNSLAWIPFGGPYLPLSGGTITGPLTLPANNQVTINGPPGSQRSIVGQTAGVTRWVMMLGDQTSDLTGSNFSLWNANNAGALTTPCFSINRLSGVATFSQMISIPGGSAGQFLSTNGVGGLSWATPAGGGGGGGIPEAPTDGQLYGRQSAAWTVVPSGGGGGIPDAPNDGSGYFRKNAAWTHVFSADIVDLATTLGPYALSSSVPIASTTPPLMNGTVNTGSGSTWARADHVHPVDTSRYAASNPSGYQTAAQVTSSINTALTPYALTTSLPPASNTLPLIDGTAAAGTATAYARADHVHPAPTIAAGDITDSTYFGDGSDFAATITTAVTLTRDMYYSNLTVSGAGVLNCAGFRVFVSGVLDISAAAAGAIVGAAITVAGSGSGTTGGALGAAVVNAAGWAAANIAATAGGTGGATGANGGNVLGLGNTLNGLGSPAGAGGNGGAGSGTGGSGGALGVPTFGRFRVLTTAVVPPPSATIPKFGAGAPGSGGGGGGGGAVVTGGAGGGGGFCGAVVLLFARTINRGPSTGIGALYAAGGNGGNGAAGLSSSPSGGGGAGGGGGGGGFLYLVYRFLTGASAPNALTASGGNGGNGGAAGGTGATPGGGGNGGTAGYAMVFNLAAGTVVTTGGATASAPSGQTGGAGGAALVTL